MFHFQAHAVPARPQADPFICNTCITQTGQHSFTAIEYESAVVSFDVSVEVVHLMRSTQYHCLATRELNERNPIIFPLIGAFLTGCDRETKLTWELCNYHHHCHPE